MTTGPGAWAENYLILQRKGQLFPAITVAAHRLRRLPVWRDRAPIDPAPLFDAIEDAVVQATFFCNEALNAALEAVFGAARSLVDGVRTIQDTSRPGFGGTVHDQHRADDDAARQRLDHAIAAFVAAARNDLRIDGAWRGIEHAEPISPADDRRVCRRD
ncbi:MAG TPA: hypothetical protein VGL47_42480 [Amycolatopsis sp.]|uniref:Uncharacterized protein n=1 Tax=Amycolatopsis nalaikhensis TaxID=715472 RepID=A0ABY8Y1J9_9PSEU|nr:hypothetical protein [Amycolatopsis sp. 2-2]WIV61879.1 hypothetical protein QP939_26345 [Amycolatopsis sp. 2-2]